MLWHCPTCKGPLTLDGDALRCKHCSIVTPVVGGIPRFVATIDRGFDQRWQRHPKPQATTAGIFENKTGWAPSDLVGKTVLDAGCGCGRFCEVTALWGASVVGVDGSLHGIQAARDLVPTGQFAQANLLSVPLPDESVDAAFSIGVLHHTAVAESAFREVARTVRQGGQLAVWLYIAPGGDGETLVADPVVSLAAEFLHAITRCCPPETLHRACERYAVRLRDLYAGQWGPLQQVLRASVSPDDEECVSDTFDWHCPQYRSGHTNEEVRGWFERAGFVVDRVGDFPVSIRGIRK